jgi:thimet oligopeptidase
LLLTRSLNRLLAIALWWAITSHAFANPAESTAVDGWNFDLSPTALAALCEKTLEHARSAFADIEQDTNPATLERVYGAYDAMSIDLQAIHFVWYMKAVHPDPEVQAAAEQCANEYSKFSAEVNLSPQFYQRVASIQLGDASDAERLMINKRLVKFRKVGADRDEKTRERVQELIAEISKLKNEFQKNIRTDKRHVKATVKQLEGLPADFVAAHPPDKQGMVEITTDYPDYIPVIKYATDDDLRRRLYIAAKNVATPTNSETLASLIELRDELARLLGYKSYAAMAMDGLMADSPTTVQQFLAEVGNAAKKSAGQDMSVLLARLQEIDPDATQVNAWQFGWLSHLVQQEQFALDAREVRSYFHFDKVQDGIFRLTENLFGVEIVPWQTQTWHKDVTAWEIREQGKPLGRFYLDMHPREHKYGHAAHWTLRSGLKDSQLPLSGMATNFPTGLMEHNQVNTFLHEFGHLLHNMFSGTQQWLDISGMSMERDFVEAPSQMLEEWVWDYGTLKEFATNDKGETIESDLVTRMNAARHFGEAAGTAGQLFYATLSLNYYNRDPKSFQLLPLLIELQERYSPFPYAEGTHFYNNFGHLSGYSSNYYIYQWSRAISTDLFTRFQRQGLQDSATARAYREKVLAPGGSKPAWSLVEDFLGRPFSPTAYTEYLIHLNQPEDSAQTPDQGH